MDSAVSDKLPASRQMLDAAEFYFEPRLRDLGLDRESIAAQQSLEDLDASLKRIDKAIEDADAFGSVRISRDGSLVLSERAGDEGTAVLGARVVLLRRKQEILDRIQGLRAEAAEQSLQRAGKPDQDPEGAAKASEDALTHLEKFRSARTASAALQPERAPEEAKLVEVETELILRQADREKREQDRDIRQSYLKKELVASLVGAVLLLTMGGALVIAMFVGTAASDVITNSFLLILGYFFGQSLSRDGYSPTGR